MFGKKHEKKNMNLFDPINLQVLHINRLFKGGILTFFRIAKGIYILHMIGTEPSTGVGIGLSIPLGVIGWDATNSAFLATTAWHLFAKILTGNLFSETLVPSRRNLKKEIFQCALLKEKGKDDDIDKGVDSSKDINLVVLMKHIGRNGSVKKTNQQDNDNDDFGWRPFL